jgi:hypothetical protein
MNILFLEKRENDVSFLINNYFVDNIYSNVYLSSDNID